jgi:hypothetical protein
MADTLCLEATLTTQENLDFGAGVLRLERAIHNDFTIMIDDLDHKTFKTLLLGNHRVSGGPLHPTGKLKSNVKISQRTESSRITSVSYSIPRNTVEIFIALL